MNNSPSPKRKNANITFLLRLRRRLILLLFFMGTSPLVSSCGVRDRAYDPTHPIMPPKGAYVVPAGVLIPRNASPDVFRHTGLYPESGKQVETCCFVSPRVTIRFAKSSAARALQLVVYIPKWKIFNERPQGVEVSAGSDEAHPVALGVRDDLRPGLHRLLFSLPASLADLQIPLFVGIHAHVSVIPEREEIGPDRRELGFVLLGGRFI